MASKNRKLTNPQDYYYHAVKLPDAPQNEPYIRVFPSTINHPKFVRLSASAQMLYIRFCVRCLDDSSYRTRCEFPKTAVDRIMDGRTFRRARDDLMENGFIKCSQVTAKGEKIKYRLSDAWKRYEGVVPESERYF